MTTSTNRTQSALPVSDRVGQLTDLVRRISAMDDPADVQREFSQTMADFSPWQGYISVSRRGLEPGRYKITSLILSDEERTRERVNPWEHWDQISEHSGGWIGEMIREDRSHLINDLCVVDDPVLGDRLKGFRSAVVVPLFDNGESLNWAIGLHHEPNAFTPDQVEEFIMRGNLIGRVTRNLVIRQELDRLNLQFAQQLQEIAAIQRSLLPEVTPTVDGLEIATSYLTSQHAGGDYFDFFEMEDRRFGVIIADVAGHGAGAATVVAILQALLHSAYAGDQDPAATLNRVSRELVRKKIENSFVTAFFAVFDPDRRRIIYSNAGHNRPLIRRADGRVEEVLGAASIPLGITTELEYETATCDLGPGDTLILYTDGIVEAFAPRDENGNREMFGKHRLIDTLRTCTGEPDCVIGHIHQGLYEHTGVRTRDDDQTVVVIRVGEL
ncbi:MAG: PP2C family protein-serine/threonine phosphatase [Phycisphaerales bacterium JB050]